MALKAPAAHPTAQGREARHAQAWGPARRWFRYRLIKEGGLSNSGGKPSRIKRKLGVRRQEGPQQLLHHPTHLTRPKLGSPFSAFAGNNS